MYLCVYFIRHEALASWPKLSTVIHYYLDLGFYFILGKGKAYEIQIL